MGLLATLTGWLTGRARVDLGGGDERELDTFTAPGDDSQPLPEDRAVTVGLPGAGQRVIVGWQDTDLEPVAEAGDVRRYSRSLEAEQAELWLHSDGQVDVRSKAGGGLVQLLPDGSVTVTAGQGGDVTINGVTFDAGGNVSTAGDVTASGVSLKNHTHGVGTLKTTAVVATGGALGVLSGSTAQP